MELLGREDILKADDRPREVVAVPEWNGNVLVRGLSGAERDKYFASMTVVGKKGEPAGVNAENATAKLVAMCIIDQDGNPLFTQRDVHELGQKSSAALERVFNKAQDLSGLSDEDVDRLGEDSGPSPSDDSALILPPGLATP